MLKRLTPHKEPATSGSRKKRKEGGGRGRKEEEELYHQQTKRELTRMAAFMVFKVRVGRVGRYPATSIHVLDSGRPID